MPSKRKLASVVDRGVQRGSTAGREQEVAVVEVDATFGRMLGLTDGQKVDMGASLTALKLKFGM